MNHGEMLTRLELACRFLASQQVRQEEEVDDAHRRRHLLKTFVGSIWGEWRLSTGRRSFFCPLWHAGQAIKAWVMAAEHLGPAWLDPARGAARFLLDNQLHDGPDAGLMLGYEDFPDLINTSAQLEAIEGLFVLADATGESSYAQAAVACLRWVADHAVIAGAGLLRDLYDPTQRTFVERRHFGAGRPLLDGAVWTRGHACDPQAGFLAIAQQIAGRLLADEEPRGNWVRYQPALRQTRSLHPRHAYWWGRPMLAMWDATGDPNYLFCFQRSVEWYRQALRTDGGLFRDTRDDFRTASFGQVASGSACAAIMFLDAASQCDDPALPALAGRALDFALSMQLTQPQDPRLLGAVIELLHVPDGSEATPYHLRDTGTIFTIQAIAQWLSRHAEQ